VLSAGAGAMPAVFQRLLQVDRRRKGAATSS
jgi:hypothetical protein